MTYSNGLTYWLNICTIYNTRLDNYSIENYLKFPRITQNIQIHIYPDLIY